MIIKQTIVHITAGPGSLEEYFQKGPVLGQIQGQIRKNCSRAFRGLSYLAYKILKRKISN